MSIFIVDKSANNLRVRVNLFWCITLLLLITSCASAPERVELDIDGKAEQILSASILDQSVLKALVYFGIPLMGDSSWSLDQLTVAAWQLRAETFALKADIDAALANEKIAAQIDNPVLSYTPEYVLNPDLGVSRWVIAVASSFVARTNSKTDLSVEVAESETAVLIASRQESLWAIREEVHAAVFNLYLTDCLRDDSLYQLKLQKDYRDWVEKRVSVGLQAKTDLLQADKDLASVQLQAAQLEGIEEVAKTNLAAALGVSVSSISGLKLQPMNEQLLSDLKLDATAITETALISRTDIRRALSEYDRADASYRLAVAGRYPDLTLSPGVTYDQGAKKIVLGVSAPIQVLHDESAAIARALAQRQAAAARFDQTQNRALSEIELGITAYESAQKNLQRSENVAIVSGQMLESVQKRFDTGSLNKGELILAELSELQARISVANSRQALFDAVISLESSIQAPVWPKSQLTESTDWESR